MCAPFVPPANLSQHPDEDRPESLVLLAVDQQVSLDPWLAVRRGLAASRVRLEFLG
jgi:hypothetical protein